MKDQIFVPMAALVACCLQLTAQAGIYQSITIDGDTSDWAGITPAYVNENGVNNPSGVDFQNVYLANDGDYLFIRFTLQQPADPISGWNTYIWIDHDNSSATGFNPFGNPNFGSSLMIINDQAYQQTGGGWNEGALLNANVAYGGNSLPGTDFEYRISLGVTGVSGDYDGVALLNGPTFGVQFASETGSGDSLPAWDNYGTLSYTVAAVPEPTTAALVGFGVLLLAGRGLASWKNHRRTNG